MQGASCALVFCLCYAKDNEAFMEALIRTDEDFHSNTCKIIILVETLSHVIGVRLVSSIGPVAPLLCYFCRPLSCLLNTQFYFLLLKFHFKHFTNLVGNLFTNKL